VALGEVAARAPVPVPVVDELRQRLPVDLEAALCSSATGVTNAAKHARPSEIWVHIGRRSHSAYIAVLDDRVGGASLDQGTGLRGLTDGTVGGTSASPARPAPGQAEVPLAAQRRAAQSRAIRRGYGAPSAGSSRKRISSPTA
jgi:hypothetical protein